MCLLSSTRHGISLITLVLAQFVPLLARQPPHPCHSAYPTCTCAITATTSARDEEFKDTLTFTPSKSAVHDANTRLLMSPRRSKGSKGEGDQIAENGGEIKVSHFQ